MDTRAKFMLTKYNRINFGSGVSHEFSFTAEYDPGIEEVRRFSKGMPSGEIRMVVDNPPVIKFLAGALGKQFYLDFTPVADDSAS